MSHRAYCDGEGADEEVLCARSVEEGRDRVDRPILDATCRVRDRRSCLFG